MVSYIPRAAVPEHVRCRDDVRAACASHDLGRLFFLVRKWGGISYSAIAECTGIKPERVGALARGEGAITSYNKLAEVADGLRLPGSLFGLTPRPWETTRASGVVVPRETVTAFRRPGFGLLVEAMTTDRPERVTGEDVAGVWANVRFVSSWDYSRGGGSMAAVAVSQHARSAAGLLRLPCDPRVRSDLFSAVGSLVLKAGFTAFDVFDHDRARQRFEFALACAEEVDDWHLRAGALARLGRQAFWRDDLETARTHVELALVRSDRLTATERSMLHALRARVFAALGDVDETLRCVGAADEEFTRAGIAPDTATAAYFDAAEHAGETGHALADIATAEHWQEAARRLREASAHHGEAYARSRAFCDFRLTALLLAIGQVEEATAVGRQALTRAHEVRSQRLALDAGRVLAAAVPYQRLPDLRELRAGFRGVAS
ncbi:MAG: hypothetical protein QG608_1969 [Actinomycetota bacterium]|nr:hypothetical protein [Actinomycetota bacterium]